MQPPLQSRAVAARRPGEEVTEKKAASKVPKVGVACKASKEERAQFISFFFTEINGTQSMNMYRQA